jgi:hypothetical protein
VQLLVAGQHVDGEVDAGRTVQLRDDDALGAVDDELTATDHDRDLAEVDSSSTGSGLSRRTRTLNGIAVGEAELAALVGRVARAAELVADVLERHRLVVRVDREVSRRIASSPTFSRRLNGTSDCKKSAYDFVWISVRFGTS